MKHGGREAVGIFALLFSPHPYIGVCIGITEVASFNALAFETPVQSQAELQSGPQIPASKLESVE